MLSSLVIKNFKSYVEAVIPLASITFLIGPNASGKSNALEAFRLLSWLARGMRLDDIERTIQNGDAHIRGRAADLFKDATAGLTIGCHLDEPELSWNELQLEIGMSNAQLVLTGEAINASSEVLPLYRVEGLQSEHTNVLSVMYNNFKRGKYKPHVSCTNQQAIFYQLETPGRFFQKDTRAQKEIPAVVQCFREQLRNIVFSRSQSGSHAGLFLCWGQRTEGRRLQSFQRSRKALSAAADEANLTGVYPFFAGAGHHRYFLYYNRTQRRYGAFARIFWQ